MFEKIFDDNLFVKNFHIKLGELLTVYKDDTVKLICNEDMKDNIRMGTITVNCNRK